MSKYNIIIRNVSNIDDNVKFIINNFFSEKDLEKLKGLAEEFKYPFHHLTMSKRNQRLI